jgi:hypothetical protein
MLTAFLTLWAALCQCSRMKSENHPKSAGHFPRSGSLAAGWPWPVRIIGLGTTVVLLAGCQAIFTPTGITGSGRTVTKTLDLTDFSRVAAGGAFEVQITRGTNHAVAITVDDNLVDYLDVGRSANTLRLYMQPNVSLRNATLKAAVTMPELIGLTLSGATRGRIQGFGSEKPLEVDLSGASHLQGNITTRDARFHVSGASHVELQGSADKLRVHASGASHLDLERYQSGDTTVRASGASHATVNPSGELDAEAEGASSVRYVGQPTAVKAHTSGASSVKQK